MEIYHNGSWWPLVGPGKNHPFWIQGGLQLSDVEFEKAKKAGLIRLTTKERRDMAKEKKELSPEELKAERQALQDKLTAIVEQERVTKVLAEEKEKQRLANEKAKRDAIEAKARAQWKPLVRISGCQRFDNDLGRFTSGMSTYELRQHIKTGQVKAFEV